MKTRLAWAFFPADWIGISQVMGLILVLERRR